MDCCSVLLLGASVLEEIHCGHRDGQLCFFREHKGWRRTSEVTEEGKEAPRQDELQVTHTGVSVCLITPSVPVLSGAQRTKMPLSHTTILIAQQFTKAMASQINTFYFQFLTPTLHHCIKSGIFTYEKYLNNAMAQ